MNLIDDTLRILNAMRELENVTVTTKWPKGEAKIPVVLVTLAGDRSADRRDDRRYLTELEYYVRVFAARADDMRRACADVHTALEGLGYELTFRWEEPGEGWRQTALRYKIYL